MTSPGLAIFITALAFNLLCDSVRGSGHRDNCVSFSIEQAEILGIVGESASGKTMTCSAMLGLLPDIMSVYVERLTLGDNDLRSSPPEQIRGKLIPMIFQNPAAALNPVITVKS